MTADKKPKGDFDEASLQQARDFLTFITLSDREMAGVINSIAGAADGALVTQEVWQDYIVPAIEQRDNTGDTRIAIQNFVRKALERYGTWKEGEDIVQHGEWSDVVAAVSCLLDARYGVYAERAAILFVFAVFKKGVHAVTDVELKYHMGRPPADVKISPDEDDAVREALQKIEGMKALLWGHANGLTTTVQQQEAIKRTIDGILDDPTGYVLGTLKRPGEEGYRPSLEEVVLGRGYPSP